MPTKNLPTAYANVRDQLIEEGYDEPMRTQEEVRSSLRGMLIEAEEQLRTSAAD